MSFLVYVKDSETDKLIAFGAFDEMPLVISPDGKEFIFLTPPELDRSQFYKPLH